MHYLKLSRNFAKKVLGKKGVHQLAFCYIREAHCLMQVFTANDAKRIRGLIGRCGPLIREYGLTDDIDLLSSYYSDRAFYLALFEKARRKDAIDSMERGIALVEKRCTSDFFHIENVGLQRFMIYFFLGMTEEAMAELDEGEKLCHRHPGEAPYQRELEKLRQQEQVFMVN